MTVEHICPQTVSIQRYANTYNETGGFDKTLSTVLTGVKVDIALTEGTVMVEESGALEEYTHKMMSDTELNFGDIVVSGSDKLKIIRVYPMYAYDDLSHYEYFLRNTRLT